MKRLGFIGLGQMGGRMARHLLQAGHELVVCDCQPAAVAAVVEGAKSRGDKPVLSVSSPSEVVESLSGERSAIFTMLPNADIVRDCYLDSASGLLPAATSTSSGPDLTFVDCSTIDPGTARQVSAAAAAIGSIFADAPVGGAVPGAEAGTLTFMVGCEGDGSAVLAHVGDAFDAMGSRVVHCGKVGSGQAAKLCNNMVLASTMVSVAEAMLLGQKMGIDPKVLSEDIFNTSSARCWTTTTYQPVPGLIPTAPSSRGYEGGWPVHGMQKDVGLALQMAKECGTPVPIGERALELYNASAEAGWTSKDFSSVYKYLEGLSLK